MALEALANKTSLSVIAPEVALTILILIVSLDNFSNEDLTASALPVLSALMMILIFCISPSLALANKSSKDAAEDLFISLASLIILRFKAISRASCSVGNAMKRSPANGTSAIPITDTGVLGVAT